MAGSFSLNIARCDEDSDVIVHSEILVNGATIMMAQENLDLGAKSPETLGGSPVTMHLYLENSAAVDAMAAGCIQ